MPAQASSSVKTLALVVFACALQAPPASARSLFQTWTGPAWSSNGPVSLRLRYLPQGVPSDGSFDVQLSLPTLHCQPKRRCPGQVLSMDAHFNNDSLTGHIMFKTGTSCDLSGRVVGTDPQIVPPSAATARIGALIIATLTCTPTYDATLCLRRSR